MIKPPARPEGGTVGVVAPAGPVDPEPLSRGVARLEGMGFRVILGKSVKTHQRYLAGSDEERAEDLLRMFSRPDINAIICERADGPGRRSENQAAVPHTPTVVAIR